MKSKLWEMSWKEVEEYFRRSDTVLLPTGTIHAHGPTPISIDSSSVERIADEVGRKTGLLTLPVVSYGEDDKMAGYPGSIGISSSVLEAYYKDICTSLRRYGVRKVIFVNGHGGNRDLITRAGYDLRKIGMLISIVEWWSIGQQTMPELFPRPRVFMEEFEIGLAIFGKEAADIRPIAHKGEWGENPTRKLLGDKIQPTRFADYEYKGGKVIIPIDAWDIDLEGPPLVDSSELDKMKKTGEKIIEGVSNYIADFAREFQKINVDEVFGRDSVATSRESAKTVTTVVRS